MQRLVVTTVSQIQLGESQSIIHTGMMRLKAREYIKGHRHALEISCAGFARLLRRVPSAMVRKQMDIGAVGEVRVDDDQGQLLLVNEPNHQLSH